MVYVKKVSTQSSRFTGRVTTIASPVEVARIPVPDTIVLCNGCNSNIYPDDGYLVYLSKRELEKDLPYDLYCEDCVRRYFPKATKVQEVKWVLK